MKIINQNNKYITDIFDHEKRVTNYEEKIMHMVTNGYGCINIDGTRVAYKDTIPTEDGDIILVHIGDDEDECETGIDYAI